MRVKNNTERFAVFVRDLEDSLPAKSSLPVHAGV